ncbi:MAG: 2'-deoxycytidine 5'-triphosphate deaminase [Candidatus Pacearchaeota archaeon]|jgi:dCTP deaminase
MRRGVLPDWKIREFIKEGIICNADVNLVNPSSLDLRIGFDKWKLVGSFLPLREQNIKKILSSREIVDDHSSKEQFYVEYLQSYVMQLVESLNLPNTISAKMFNKSGRGRIGISAKGLTDGCSQFDYIKNGYQGDLYSEITATSFPLVIHSGITPIPQIRFYEGNPEPIAGSDLELLLRKHPILTDDNGNQSYDEIEKEEMIRTGKLTFTADIPKRGLLAYIAKRDRRTIDLSKKGNYVPKEYYDEIKNKNNSGLIIIHPGDFVLVNSKQNIRLPPTVAAEIDEYSPELGDMKSHYAGLINASHGYDPKNPNVPSHIVFEIRARDVPIILQDNQSLAKFNLYNMLYEPEERYMDKKSTGFKDLKSILPNVFNKK